VVIDERELGYQSGEAGLSVAGLGHRRGLALSGYRLGQDAEIMPNGVLFITYCYMGIKYN
jgi:hypothetical protein